MSELGHDFNIQYSVVLNCPTFDFGDACVSFYIYICDSYFETVFFCELSSNCL